MSGFLGGRVPDFEPKDSWLDGEAVRAAERIASVRSRMEDDKLTAEVIRVLEGKGYRVHRPSEAPLAHVLAQHQPIRYEVLGFGCTCQSWSTGGVDFEDWKAHLAEVILRGVPGGSSE